MRQARSLAFAGNALILIGVGQIATACLFSVRGGIDGILSPVAAWALVWPIAALLGYIGHRMRVAAAGMQTAPAE